MIGSQKIRDSYDTNFLASLPSGEFPERGHEAAFFVGVARVDGVLPHVVLLRLWLFLLAVGRLKKDCLNTPTFFLK